MTSTTEADVEEGREKNDMGVKYGDGYDEADNNMEGE